MDLKDKKLEDLEVTLPLANGTELRCAAVAVFDIGAKSYIALQAMGHNNKPDPTCQPMLYRVEEDAEKNPVVMYIENDLEFALAANEYAKLKK